MSGQFGRPRTGGNRRAFGRVSGTAVDDPVNPDVVPGPPEDEMGDPESVARGICLRALTGAPKTRKPEKKRAKNTALPPCLSKNASARPNLCGVMKT